MSAVSFDIEYVGERNKKTNGCASSTRCRT